MKDDSQRRHGPAGPSVATARPRALVKGGDLATGVVCGCIRRGFAVDARARRDDCFTVSDKALAVAGGVLEAVCALLGGVRLEGDTDAGTC